MLTKWHPVTGNLFVALTLMLGLIVGTFAAGAQDDATPSAALATPEATDLRPAHIHAGTCADLGDIVYPLSDVSTTEVEPLGAAGESTTTIDASLDQLLAEEYAINVHESAENIDNYIACGNIAGDVTDGQLVVQLSELNNSGFVGEAVLEETEGNTVVSLALLQADAEAVATPVTTPTMTEEPAAEQPGAEFQQGTIVATTTENLRVREQPTTEAVALTTLPIGTQLEVIDGPEQAEGFTWYEIAVVEGADPVTGWVATSADFVEAVQEAED